MNAERIRVLIVDDHAMMRAGLRRILADAPEVEFVAEAGSAQEALRLVRELELDVVLLDIALPGQSGLEALRLIHADKPGLAVLILSMYPEDQYALRVLKAGASGYLTKESAPEQLVSAICKVAAGGRYLSPAVADRLAVGLGAKAQLAPHETLSQREFEVLRLIASGQTPTQIAETLHLSVKTVGTYRARILEKMNLQSNAELTHYALKNGLVV